MPIPCHILAFSLLLPFRLVSGLTAFAGSQAITRSHAQLPCSQITSTFQLLLHPHLSPMPSPMPASPPQAMGLSYKQQQWWWWWCRGGRRWRVPSSSPLSRHADLRGVTPRSLPSLRMPDPRETCCFLRIWPPRESNGRAKHPW